MSFVTVGNSLYFVLCDRGNSLDCANCDRGAVGLNVSFVTGNI